MRSMIAHFREIDGTAQTVFEHLTGVSVLAKKHSDKISLGLLGELLGLLHDFGKFSDFFQIYIQSAVGLINREDKRYLSPLKWKGKIDHATAGAQWIWDNLNISKPLTILLREILALSICSHHGGLINCVAIDGYDRLGERIKKPDDKTYYTEACKRADERILQKAANIGSSIDIVSSLEHCLKKINLHVESQMLRLFWTGLLVRFIFSCLVDADRTETAIFDSPEEAKFRLKGEYIDWSCLADCFERHIAGFKDNTEINNKRKKISSACLKAAQAEKNLFYLTVPTGGGKTLASMRFALHHAKKHNLDRIIYVIPYTSIIEQNAQEIRNVFKNNASLNVEEIILEHHSNLLEKNDTKRNRLLSENWDAPIVFTTLVQMLETLFGGGTKGVRRMHQLARSVIIFDEIQTLPINTVHLFNNAINFLTNICSSTVVFCTATQPLLHAVDSRKGTVPHSKAMEMAPYESLFKGFRRIEVLDARKAGGWSVDSIRGEIEKQLNELGSVLFIANTKKDAKRIFAETKGLVNHRYHLSTAMCPAHRLEMLRRIKICLRRGWPVVCVSTQLVEAGVNLDFGCVFRSLAGLDSIAQAAGRCNRNNRRKLGRVLIVNLQGENLGALPEIQLAQKEALRVMDDYLNSPESFDNDLISPRAIARYYEYYFYQRASEMDYRINSHDFGRNDTLLSLLSSNSLSVAEAKRTGQLNPDRILKQAFKSAGEYFKVIDAPTQGILVYYDGFGKTTGEAERLISELTVATDFSIQKTLLKRAQRYCVNVFPQDLNKLDKAGALHETQPGSGIWYLDAEFYSSEYGVCTEQVGLMKFLQI